MILRIPWRILENNATGCLWIKKILVYSNSTAKNARNAKFLNLTFRAETNFIAKKNIVLLQNVFLYEGKASLF